MFDDDEETTTERLERQAIECDGCGKEGHSFRSCPARDDD